MSTGALTGAAASSAPPASSLGIADDSHGLALAALGLLTLALASAALLAGAARAERSGAAR